MTYTGTRRVLIGTDARGEVGSMASFDVCSGELLHLYKINHRGHLRYFSTDAVASGDGDYVFGFCVHDDYVHEGIGMWDQTTGQQIQYCWDEDVQTLQRSDFEDPSETRRDIRRKLQWLPGCKFLLVVSMSYERDWFSLLDPRSAWSWRDCCMYDMGSNQQQPGTRKFIVDAVAIEESSTLGVTGYNGRGRSVAGRPVGDLAFLDLRGKSGIQWVSHDQQFYARDQPATYSFRLAYSGSQLFASRSGNVLVMSSPDWKTGRLFQTGLVKKTGDGEIADISIGGDRLFVLHKGEHTFEVCETPYQRGTCTTGCF